ncbi:MAG TPA: hypothetical protein ENG83_12470 [Nitrospirae bacterium]|nr:hypothetical protein BMS3Abin06_02645 [bacterium BMS3Abin06]HDH12991.1 hypothetical protein [Nitrospirota bacterium]HDZ01730.1 hypothetical protein [Nitrospirota bacterium]
MSNVKRSTRCKIVSPLDIRSLEALGKQDRVIATLVRLVKRDKLSFWEACEGAITRINTVREKQGYF